MEAVRCARANRTLTGEIVRVILGLWKRPCPAGGCRRGDRRQAAATSVPGVSQWSLISGSPALTNYTSLGDWNPMEIPTAGPPPRPPTWLWPAAFSPARQVAPIPSGAAQSGKRAGSHLALTIISTFSSRFRRVRRNIQIYLGRTNNYYGTSTARWFSALPRGHHNQCPCDERFILSHLHRAHIYWRGNLSDLRIDPLGAAVRRTGRSARLRPLGRSRGRHLLSGLFQRSNSGAGTNDVNGFPVIRKFVKNISAFAGTSACVQQFLEANMPHGTLRKLRGSLEAPCLAHGIRPDHDAVRVMLTVSRDKAHQLVGGTAGLTNPMRQTWCFQTSSSCEAFRADVGLQKLLDATLDVQQKRNVLTTFRSLENRSHRWCRTGV